MSGEGYVRQIKDIDEALKRLNAQTKQLRAQKLTAKTRLYEWMKKREYDEYEGYKLAKIAPKPKIPRKKAKDKKADALRLFAEAGANDPEELYQAFLATQKVVAPQEED